MLGKQTKRRTHLTQTFQSQINEEGGSRFLMDKTLYKGIKDNDVSKIIDVSKDSGQLTDKTLPSELQQLEKIVIQMRRKYDDARTNIIKVQSQLQKLRKASEVLKAQQARLKQIVGGAKYTLQSKQKQSETLFTNVEASTYDLDIYKQMIATLKHDILVIKKRNFDKDISLKQERTRIKSLKNDDFHKTQLSHKCRGMLQSVEKAVINKQYERNSKLNTFYEALNKKHQNLRKKEQRESEIQEIMVKAMSQKLQEEKQWINICRVNLFLKKFLKCKMERLINQNSQVQGAYHKIRSNTDIKDCKDLITRFLNRQRDYGTLLESISQKEVKLQSQKYQKQQLQAKNHELRHISEQISESVHKNSQSDDSLQKELKEVQQDLKQIESKKQVMKKWATRFNCSFSNKSREQINKKYQNKSSTQLIKDVLCQITKYLDHLLGDQNCSNKINNAFMSTRPSDKNFGQDMVNRNKRVKTISMDDQYAQGDDRDGLYEGSSQAEFLQYNRRMTKKNDLNRRFRIKTQLK